jgi:hypothetical protein
MRLRSYAAAVSLKLLLAAAILAQTPAAPLHHTAAPAADAAPKTTALPVTSVSLYKNGVGFFEHTGHVTGNASVTIDFTSAQLNDVLQSLTAIDLNNGRISGADYNSTTPLDQQLRSLSLGLGANTTFAGFLTAVRGSRIAVTGSGPAFTGRLLDIEAHTSTSKDATTAETWYLSVISDAGELRTFPMTPALSVRLLDQPLHEDVNRYLQLLDTTRNQGLRHLTLQDLGTGARELRVSYISEVPIWKSTYRILLTNSATKSDKIATLQGWSVVDNTTGADWINVHLSLIAGAPQSFIQPLSQPIYSRRPEIPIAEEQQLTPQTHDSGMDSNDGNGSSLQGTVTDPSGAVVPNATITATNASSGYRQSATANANGRYSLAVPAGTYHVETSMPGFQTYSVAGVNVSSGGATSLNARLNVGSTSETIEVTSDAASINTESVNALPLRNRSYAQLMVPRAGLMAPPPPPPPPSYEDSATDSVNPNTTTAAFDAYFAYNLSEPITLLKNESALVPILQAKIPAEPVTLVSLDRDDLAQPLRALWITNSSGLTLDRGSFSIVENGSFGGQGLLDPIHPGERRLLSYAADQAIHVSTETSDADDVTRYTHLSASKGVVQLAFIVLHATTYDIHNSAADPRTVILEHPVEEGFTLDPGSTPDETTASVYRFRVEVAPGQTAKLHVSAKKQDADEFQLAQAVQDEFAVILTDTNNDPNFRSAVAPILQARRNVADAQTLVDQTRAELTRLAADQTRLRDNITALKDADKSSQQRFIAELNHDEDAIASNQATLAERTHALDAAKAELANRIQSLQLDEDLPAR